MRKKKARQKVLQGTFDDEDYRAKQAQITQDEKRIRKMVGERLE